MELLEYALRLVVLLCKVMKHAREMLADYKQLVLLAGLARLNEGPQINSFRLTKPLLIGAGHLFSCYINQ